jgi:TfoX/Sxy family transcriptional regulator of competence genes
VFAGDAGDAYDGDMPFDEQLADRIRGVIGDHPALVEKKMFGGIAFLIGGNMAVGVSGESLMVRIDPADMVAVIEQPGVRPFDLTGRPMKGWVLVDPEATTTDADLVTWIDRGVAYAESLPPKPPKV